MFRDRLEALIEEEVSQSGIVYGEAVQEFRKIFISRVLEQSDGNQIRAAQKLGMHRNTLKRKMTQPPMLGFRGTLSSMARTRARISMGWFNSVFGNC